MRKTKIIATVGPACDSYKGLKQLALAGTNVFRLNMSHGTREWHQTVVDIIKALRKELKLPLPIMLDTRGPEVRLKTFEDGKVFLKRNAKFVLTADNIIGNEKAVSISSPTILKNIKAGQKILLNDGLIELKVITPGTKEITTKVLTGGWLSNRKSLFLPNVKFTEPYLNKEDKADIIWAIEQELDFIAASFVNYKEDVEEVQKVIDAYGGNQKIISKIESALAIKNLDQIIKASFGTMVARGDLGVELPIEKIPELQKQIIKKTKNASKVCITATEMLESMINSPRPTRAETTDVANAVYDGTSAIMLSGETAMGKYPATAVKYMSSIAKTTETHINYKKRFTDENYNADNISDVTSKAAVSAGFGLPTKATVAFTKSGTCARMVSRFRPDHIIIGATTNEQVYRQLDISWGVKPVILPMFNTSDEMFDAANILVQNLKVAKKGDVIIITSGTPKYAGHTNLIKIVQVK